jgi:transaldolase
MSSLSNTASTGSNSVRESPLRRLQAFGQSPWLDFLQRGLLESGRLAQMIADGWGLKGVTSNPAIFEKSIIETQEYDREIERLARRGYTAVPIYEALAIADVRLAADLFRPIYDATNGVDGYVSLEVSPHVAHDARHTIAEARRLWSAVDRPNAMIKVPATSEGLAATRQLLAGGINVNVTLLFSVPRYREVAGTYLTALEDALDARRPIDRIASVASFFVSRIDTAVDRELDRLAERGQAAAPALRGEAAVASARLAYRAFEDLIGSKRFRELAKRGARPQRLLWASTGTKDPAYGDVKYVEPLIGPQTVNTMPLATLEAYHDHGDPAARLAGHGPEAERVLRGLAELGVEIERTAERLLEDGIDGFVRPYDALLRALERRRH